MLCAVFSLCYEQSLVCVMCSLQSRASSLRSEHASLRSRGSLRSLLGPAPIHDWILGPSNQLAIFTKEPVNSLISSPHMYIYIYIYMRGSCLLSKGGWAGPEFLPLGPCWALPLGPTRALPLGPCWALPYRAKRGMLGAKRRGSWLQTAHKTDWRLHIRQTKDCT